MDAQLRLLTAGPRAGTDTHADDGTHRPEPVEAPVAWRIDDTTRAVGRSGLARARAALRDARQPLPVHPAPAEAHATPTAA